MSETVFVGSLCRCATYYGFRSRPGAQSEVNVDIEGYPA
jgi:hypothetical protein